MKKNEIAICVEAYEQHGSISAAYPHIVRAWASEKLPSLTAVKEALTEAGVFSRARRLTAADKTVIVSRLSAGDDLDVIAGEMSLSAAGIRRKVDDWVLAGDLLGDFALPDSGKRRGWRCQGCTPSQVDAALTESGGDWKLAAYNLYAAHQDFPGEATLRRRATELGLVPETVKAD